MKPQDRSVSSSPVVEHLQQLWQQSFKVSEQYPFYARIGCPVSSHLPPIYPTCQISWLLLQLFSRNVRMNWPFIRRGFSSTQPAGFRLRNSHREAPVHTPDWMRTQRQSRERRTGEPTANDRWGLWLLGNIPHGSVHLFSDRLKREAFVSVRPNPSQGAKLCSNLWTPSISGYNDMFVVVQRSGTVRCLFSAVNGNNSNWPKTKRLYWAACGYGLKWVPLLKLFEEGA